MSSDDYDEYDSEDSSKSCEKDDFNEYDSKDSTGSCEDDDSNDESNDHYSHKRRYNQNSGPPKKFQKQSTGTGIYVLRNQQTGSCYVGKSNNMQNRIQQHRDGTHERLIQERPLTTGSTDDLESWERNEVLTRMYRYGMDSVRGWRYTRKDYLTSKERQSARNDIMEKFDLCRRCGRNSHFANSCYARSPAEWCKNVPMQ